MTQPLQPVFVVGVVLLAGCSAVPSGGGQPAAETTVQPTATEAQASSDVVSDIAVSSSADKTGSTVVQVAVEADAEEAPLQVTLSNPEDNSVGAGARQFVSESDLLDGSEQVSIRLGEDAPPGEYTAYVQQRSAASGDLELVAQETLTLEQGAPGIGDVSVSGAEAQFDDGYQLTAASVAVSNTGDLPVSVTEIALITPSDEGSLPILAAEPVSGGETQTFSTDDSYNLPQSSRERFTIEVVVRLDSGETVRKSVDAAV
jgi:hypothetical protein